MVVNSSCTMNSSLHAGSGDHPTLGIHNCFHEEHHGIMFTHMGPLLLVCTLSRKRNHRLQGSFARSAAPPPPAPSATDENKSTKT